MEAIKAVHGLADAPLAWYQSFSKRLLQLGCKQLKLDACVYHFYSNDDDRHLSGVIALRADDMCLGGDHEFEERIIHPLKKIYPFKHWHVGTGTFLGRRVEQMSSSDIHITQREYADQLKGIKLTPERKKQKDAPTSDVEKKEMRAVLGVRCYNSA